MAALLLEELKQKIRVLELEPSGGGCFEVHVDGREVWSKLKTGEFPEPEAILAAVGGRR
ncbi:MAG: Rdx family protein [Planctomycetes bacterium]|nr:Rdx family protein [Planctomycetota bacterium]